MDRPVTQPGPAEPAKKYRKVFNQFEDEQLVKLIGRFGRRSWDVVASYMPNRSARQCRDRWKFYLCPSVNRAPWTAEEDQLLLAKYRELGPRWSALCQFFENRSLNNIKNRWNSVVRKIKATGLDERSEEDFLRCAKLITQQSAVEPQRPPLPSPEDGSQDAEEFFQITNLLNHPTTKIGDPGTLC
jgi:23S rRNA U2552 (ribose-2'-O)-methylase RlmE/FtsJ